LKRKHKKNTLRLYENAIKSTKSIKKFFIYPGCISDLSYGSDDENFPFVDYDEYDAQVFKLPNRNLTMLRLKLNFVLL